MDKFRVLDLFTGIGGFTLGLEKTGMFETVAFCEIEKFPQSVLRKNWPEVRIYEDVKKLTARKLVSDGKKPNVITGGFPCQDISTAGKRAGIETGTRSGLWSECARLVGEIRPDYAIFENVANLLAGPSEKPGGWFSRVLCDLAAVGYDAEWCCISAKDCGAPHERKRIWIVAYPAGSGRPEMALYNFTRNDFEANKEWASIYAGPLFGSCSWEDWEKQSGVQLIVDGVSGQSHECKASGNAIVPQIAQIIGNKIIQREQPNSGNTAE